MAQRCTYCGRTKAKHKGPDGKYRACVDLQGFKRALPANESAPQSLEKGDGVATFTFDEALNKIAPYLEGVPDAHLRAVQIVSALVGAAVGTQNANREYQLSVACFKGRDSEWRLALQEYLSQDVIAKIESEELVDADPRQPAAPSGRAPVECRVTEDHLERARIIFGRTDNPLFLAQLLANFDGGIALLEELRKELFRAVTVLCETRGHAGYRPCQFCSDMHLWKLRGVAQAAPEQSMEALRRQVELAVIRYQILLDRMAPCVGVHDVSKIEVPGWIDEAQDILRQPASKELT